MHDAEGSAGARRRSLKPTLAWAVLAFLILAVALRLIRYLLNYPMWGDETMLAVNLLGAASPS